MATRLRRKPNAPLIPARIARRQRPTLRKPPAAPAPGARKARRKFLKVFPRGFRDETYLDWERDYKWRAAEQWQSDLSQSVFRQLLAEGKHDEIARRAIRIESRTNLLFSFEKMALRDAVRSEAGAMAFSQALYAFLHGPGAIETRFGAWTAAIAALPRRQTRVLTWPLATVFGFLAEPRTHFFFKPLVTRTAFRRYGYDLPYASRPSGALYGALLAAVERVRRDIRDLRPRDMIDLQSFLWVQGSDEYADW